MEFKGTNVKWGVDKFYGQNVITYRDGKKLLFLEIKHNDYNAQLIAHAPEMLEALIKCKSTLKDVYGCDTSEIDNLINRATTI